MAIFHFSARIISRGKGQSAIAAAAYRSGERLRDEQADEQKFYAARAERILFTDIMAPKDAPEWAHDRNRLWNEAERAEKRKDAQLAREIEVSLPHELTARQREFLIKDFAREAFVRKGFAVDIAIHAPDRDGDHRNHHAHLMVTRRTIGADGFAPTKDWRFDKAQLGEWREQWAHLANRHLARHGHATRIDHRSLEGQGVDREPTVHVGYAAAEMTQRGAPSDRMAALEDVLARNDERIRLREDQAAIGRELKELERLQEQESHQLAVQAKVEAERQQAREAAQRAEEVARRAPAQPMPQEQPRSGPVAQPAPDAHDPPETRQAAAQPRQEAVAAPAPRGQSRPQPVVEGLRVIDTTTGATARLADFMLNLVAGPAPAPQVEKSDMKAFATDPAARKQQQLARLAASRQAKDAEKAIDRIAEDMKAGRNLKAEDIRSLTRQHQEQIRSFGDAAVQQMVDSARRRSEQYWKGDERERER